MGIIARLKDSISNAGKKVEGTFVKSDAEIEVERRKEMDERAARRIRVNEENYKKTSQGRKEEANKIEVQQREKQKYKESVEYAKKESKEQRRIELEDERKVIRKARSDARRQAKIDKAAARGKMEGSRVTTAEYLNRKLNPVERWRGHIQKSTEVQGAQQAGEIRGERYAAMQGVIRSNTPQPGGNNFRRPYSGGGNYSNSSVEPYTGRGSMNADPYFSGIGGYVSPGYTGYPEQTYTQTHVPNVLNRDRETQNYQLYFGSPLPVVQTRTVVGRRPKKYDTFFGWK
jgi:hypothetical protein